ncbi:MAG: DUF3209 family protein [Leptospirales bacterium]|nr:DUF3209 family protein [Leptospirales bacterium]
MACHELAALRLGLMEVIGIDDPAEKEHELKEIGNARNTPGPVKSLLESNTLEKVYKFYGASLADLQEKVSKTAPTDPSMPYYRTLLVLTKKVEQDLQMQIENLKVLYNDLDEIHHFVHEIYPGKEED